MSKQVSKLSSTARGAIVASFCDAIAQNDQSGTIVTLVCNTAHKYMRGEPIEKGDAASIVDAIARNRGWKGDSADSRKSECNAVLKSYAILPEAIKALQSRVDKCHWHDALKLARRLNRGDSVKQAVTFVATKKKGGGEGNPQGRAAGALSGLFDACRGAKRDAVIAAVRALVRAEVIKLTGKTAEKFANA